MSGSTMGDPMASQLAMKAVEGLQALLSRGLTIDDPKCQTLIDLISNSRALANSSRVPAAPAPAPPSEPSVPQPGRPILSPASQHQLQHQQPLHYQQPPQHQQPQHQQPQPLLTQQPGPYFPLQTNQANNNPLSFQMRQQQILASRFRSVPPSSSEPSIALPSHAPNMNHHPPAQLLSLLRQSPDAKANVSMTPLLNNLPQTEGNVLFNSAAAAAAAANLSKETVGREGRQPGPHYLSPDAMTRNAQIRGGIKDEDNVFQTKAQIMAVRRLRRGQDVPEEILLAAKGANGCASSNGDARCDLHSGTGLRGVANVDRVQAFKLENERTSLGPTAAGLANGRAGVETGIAEQKELRKQLEHRRGTTEQSGAALNHKLLLQQQDKNKLPDYAVLVSERERRIRMRMQSRLQELDNLPMDLPNDIRRRAVIEAKEIKLAGLQRQVRNRVTSEMHKLLMSRERMNDLMAMASKMRNAEALRVSTIPEATRQDMQRLEHKHRLEQKRRNEARQRAMLESLMKHSMEFRGLHFNIHTVRKRLHKDLDRHFRDRARDEERRKRKEQIDRLKALRSNDEEQYLKLLQNTKNTRLLQLLKQTDEYLIQIGAQVEQQKQNAMAELEVSSKVPKRNKGKVITGKHLEEPAKPKSPIRSDADTIDAMRRRRDEYYTISHSIKEKVHQPSNLVGGILKPYQLDGLSWLISLYNNNLNGILADEMGLGKTIQTIALLAYLFEVKRSFGPFLIIVPLSTLSNWVRELDVWAPSLIKVIYRGDPQTRKRIQRVELQTGRYNILLTTYEFIVKDKSVLGRIRWKYIIIDEGHRMKNADSKLALTLGAKYRSRNRVLLTGTPLQNNLTELWALLNFLLPTIFSSAESFETWFNAPFQARALGNTELNEEETLLVISRLHQVLRPFMLRRLKTDVEAQLPEKVEAVIRVPMSIWQKTLYRQVRNKLGIATASGSSKMFNNMIMQFKKICNHPYLFYTQTPEALAALPPEFLVRAAGKFEMLNRSLPKLVKTGHRTLIFSQMTKALDYLEYLMQDIGISHLRLDGTTKADERRQLLQAFNEKDSAYSCFLLSTRAGGLGLNLQSADTVIIFDSDWNPMMDQQAQDRAHRIGQTKEVRVLRLISSNSVEEKILEQANRKLQIDAQVIQAGRFNNKVSDADRTRILKEIIQNQTDNNPHEEEDATHSDANMINRVLARSEEEMELFESMDAEYEKLEEAGVRKGLMVDESELPEWVTVPEVEEKTKDQIQAELLMSHGRGRRQRKQVIYDDGLTEEQWTRMVEDGKDIEEEALKRKREASSTEPEGNVSGGGRSRRRRPRSSRASSTPAPSDSTDNDIWKDTERPSRRRRKRKLISYTMESGDDTEANDDDYNVFSRKRARRLSRSPST